jgi:hypothetical protein
MNAARSSSSPVGAAISATVICDRRIASSRATNRARAAASDRWVRAESSAARPGRVEMGMSFI